MTRIELGFAERFRSMHWGIVLLLLTIGVIGYAVLYSAGGGSHEPWAWRHGMKLAVGLAIMMVVAFTDIRIWFKLAFPIFLLGMALLIGVEVLGSLSKGAQRWIDLGIIRLQPSELMKIALLMALARYFHPVHLDEIGRPAVLIVPLAMIALPAALVLRQPDLGTTLMLLAAGSAVLFLAGVRWWKFAAVAAAVAAALPVLWSQLHDYQKQRVLTFLEPERDPLGSGYHIIQSKIALGSGGLWGKGYLNGSQAQLSFLPEKQTDFAFTMLAEETGFVGALVVLGLYLTLILVSLAVAIRASHQFGRLLAAGLTVNLFLYVMINVAMVTGLIPVVGVPLPLISYGGTAMITTLIGLGLVLSIEIDRDTPIPRFPVNL